MTINLRGIKNDVVDAVMRWNGNLSAFWSQISSFLRC